MSPNPRPIPAAPHDFECSLDKLRFIEPRLWPVVVIALAFAIAPDSVQCWLKLNIGTHITDTIYNISGSIIAAFVFYLFLDANRRWREVRAVAPYVSRLVRNLQGDVKAVCIEAARANGTQLPDNWQFNSFDVERIFRNTNPHAQSNMEFLGGRKANIYEYIYDRLQRTETFLDQIMLVNTQLGAEGLIKLLEVRNSSYLSQLRSLRNLVPHLKNKDMSVFSGIICEHYASLEEFEAWAVRNGFWSK